MNTESIGRCSHNGQNHTQGRGISKSRGTGQYILNLTFVLRSVILKGGKFFTFDSIFGCVSYVNIEIGNKMADPKDRKCYFIGYGSSIHGYMFWDEQNQKTIHYKKLVV